MKENYKQQGCQIKNIEFLPPSPTSLSFFFLLLFQLHLNRRERTMYGFTAESFKAKMQKKYPHLSLP